MRRVPLLTASAVVCALAACVPATPSAVTPASGKRVESDHGMVAASHPDAAAAGLEILQAGGNAVDAGVATAFALSVTDVSQTGLGGGGALMFYNARTKRTEHLIFYPRAGEDPAWGQADADRSTPKPGRAAGVPGQVAGLLEAQAKFGKLTRAQVMAPAIRLARDGFIVSPLLSRTITASKAKLQVDSLAMARFMPRGEALRPGERLVQPELAATLTRIATEGASAFYTGAIAEHLSAKVKSQGGLITVRDMNTYTVQAQRPLCTMWRGYTLLSAPPPMGGSNVIEMLQLADASGLANMGGFTEQPDAVARMADILRVGGADARWRGDPFAMPVPARGVSSPAFAATRAKLLTNAAPDSITFGDAWAYDSAAAPGACAGMEPYAPAVRPAGAAGRSSSAESTEDATNTASPYTGSNTSHFAVVDADGNAVSATTTVGVLFGSGVYTDGFFLNSAGSNFDARTRGTNRYANSTMSPTIILDREKVRLVVGAAGSQYIQPAITQVTLRMLAYGEDPAIALGAPRIYASVGSKDVEVEPGFAPAVYQALVAHGYKPQSRVADITFGGVHAIFVRKDGRRIGVADPRRDGVAAGH